MPTNELLADTKKRMDQSVEALLRDLATMRTGRASLAMLDGIRVDYYGTPTPLNQVGNLAVPDPTLITLQPWDPTTLATIEKAIRTSDLDLNPQNDGKIIRILIPPLTEERRKELVKVIHKMCEDHKIAVRNIRRDSNELIKGFKKDGDISEDEAFKGQDEIQEITNNFVNQIDGIYKEKEKEIIEF